MLSYVGHGERRYGLQPVHVHSRKSWEFEAVLSGRIAPLRETSAQRPELRSASLWVFAPGVGHGWTGDGEHPSEVAVFHCQSVPEPLASLPGGWLCVALDGAEIDSLRSMATELEPEVWSPTLKGELQVTRAVAELCLIALKTTANRPLLEGGARQRAIVQAATIWYGEHLSAGPTLEQIARAVHVSASHLRRLFHRVRRRSPRRVLDDVRFERARALLKGSELSLEAIAEACGYSDASALSRGFRKRRGKPPGAWRRKA